MTTLTHETDTRVEEIIDDTEKRDKIGEASALAKRAILVYPNLRSWGGKKIDRKHTDELNERHSSEDKTTRVVQQLLKPLADACKKPIAAMRTRSDQLTLPYSVDGWKILPSAMYFDYVKEMRHLENVAYDTIEDELSKYEMYLLEERKRKNGLFVPEMYPTKDEIRSQYDINFYFKPIPDAGNWIVDIEREEMSKLRETIAESELNEIYNGVRVQWDRLHSVVNKMLFSLSEYGKPSESGKRTKTFRDSLVGNIEDLCEILPKLNLTGDVHLAEMTGEVRERLASKDPDALRKDPELRKDTMKEAKDILDAMAGFIG